MLPIIDLMVDNSDDIVFSYNDFQVEESIAKSTLDVAARRICGREDDNPYRQKLCAGLEQWLFSHNINTAIGEIIEKITQVLTRDGLFVSSDFNVSFGESYDPREAKLYIVFTKMKNEKLAQFKIFVDIENQRVYRGR